MNRRLVYGIVQALFLVVILTSAHNLGLVRVGGGVSTYFSSGFVEPPATQWNKTYGGAGSDVAFSVEQTSDGGYIVAGAAYSLGAGGYDFWLVKTDASGTAKWTKTYGGSAYDEAHSVQQTSDGGYIVAGYTESSGAGIADFWLVKTDGFGNPQWSRTYGGSRSDVAWSVQQTSDGGYILAGYTYSFGAGYKDFLLVKTDASGTKQWSKTYGGTSSDVAWSVQQTSDGGYILAGYTFSFGSGYEDFWLVRTDASGTMQWSKTYGGSAYDEAHSVQQTTDGGYIVAGYTESFGSGYKDFWLVRTDASGTMQWSKTYGGSGSDEAYSVRRTTDGGYILAGHTYSFGMGSDDFWLIETDAGGTIRWNKTCGASGSEVAYSVFQTDDEGFIVAGCTYSFGAGKYDFWLVKLAPSAEIHDVAVVDVTPYPTKAYVGQSVNINVVVNNEGTVTETFDVIAYYNDDPIQTKSVTNLAPANQKNLTFTWNTTNLTPGNYTISATAIPVIDEIDTTDNTLVDGIVEIMPPPDIAIIKIMLSKTVVAQGYLMTIKVTVENQGNYTETFNVTACANTTIIQTENISLTQGNSTTVIFTWNTTGVSKGNYTISANATILPGETDTADNIVIDGIVTVTIRGDVDGDFDVDIYDVSKICAAYDSEPPGPPYDPNYDINGNGKIDIYDVVMACAHYGQKDP